MGDLIQQLGKVVLAAGAGEWTDAHLLESFLATHDETAFEMLVRRHGPMVLGVCRRTLSNPQDVEDAFQATFLVLVRKANSVVPRGMVGNWLYGVAYQTAVKARARAQTRGAREQQIMDAPEPAVRDNDEALWRELRPIIDEELSRLPAKYRAPLVLCDIEEKSYKDAAEQLGWPEGTVAGRLSRARAMLAGRLSRRGVVPAVALPLLLAQNAVSASVPAALLVPTVKAAAMVAAGQATAGAVSANVVALTEGVVKAMMLTKLKVATAVLFAVCLVVTGAGFAFSGAAADGQEKKKPAQPPAQPQPLPKDKKADDKKGGNNEQNGNNNQNGNDEKNGQNNQNGNNEQNGNNNQNGNDEKNGQNNQNGKNEPNGNNNQNGNDEQGVVKAIDQNGKTITVVVNQKGKPVEKVFQLPKDVPVVLGGKAAKLADVKPGMKIGVAFDKEKKGVVGIKQVNEPNGQNNNGNNGQKNG